MPAGTPSINALQLWITHDATLVTAIGIRAFDWTVEEGATEDAPVLAGDATCTIPTALAVGLGSYTPNLFEFCTKRPATRIDEVDVRIPLSNGSRGGGYRMTDCLVSSFRVQDGGGIAGLEAGVTTITFDWLQAEVSWEGNIKTYVKPKG